ncbi:MAG: hypothetical protein ACE5GT_02375 [Rhodospirillales bacterium]
MARFLLLLVAASIIAGCTYYSLVPPGTREIAGTYSVKSEIPWSKATEGKTDLWTVDGMGLQELRFVNGLADGDRLFSGEKFGEQPEYKENMTFLEIKELIETSAAVVGAVGVKTRDFRPHKFGNLEGFRAEFSFTTEDGLLRDGFVVGTKKDNKLYLIMYSGSRLHYFPKHKDDAEYIVRSIRVH